MMRKTTKIAVILTAAACSNAFAESTNTEVDVSIPVTDIQRFTTILEHVKNYYVNNVNDKQLFEESIKGMLAGLDPHSTYLDQSDYSELKSSTSGKFGGIGIEVTMEDGFIRVISPIDDTPAAKAGVQPGDLIIKLDDTAVKGMSIKEAIDKMRGKKGTKITLTIIRKDEDKPVKTTLVRDIINSASVKFDTYDGSYGYLRISQFQGDTASEVRGALKKMEKKLKKSPQGLIIDLRNNPGGILESSVEVADFFLDSKKLSHDGLIVYAKGRAPGTAISKKSQTGDFIKGAPIVVLVNSGTASAGEILTGALQDHNRAIILGTKTFGKGSVQTVIPLKDNHGLKLTTALYYTPAGRSIQATGLTPDIEINNLNIPRPESEDLSSLIIKESDLNGHLSNGNDNTETNTSKKEELELIHKDYQLHEALNLLKAMYITSKNRG